MKRFISGLLVIVLVFGISGGAIGVDGGGYFVDVPADAWYADYVDICYEAGLLQGVGDNTFAPDAAMTYAQMLTATARLHHILNGGDGNLPVIPEEAVVGPVVNYAGEWYADAGRYWDNLTEEFDYEDEQFIEFIGIVWEHPDVMPVRFEDDCPRTLLAFFLWIAVSGKYLVQLNADATIPDLDSELLRQLYRAGILDGVDEDGTFDGSGIVTRAQLAAVLARVLKPTLRIGYTHSTDTFDFRLLALMPQNENYMMSPISLKMALTMAANGASGETRQEILDVLGISDINLFNEETRAFIRRLNANESVQFNIANSIWYNTDIFGDEDIGFSDAYINTIKEYYYGSAETITSATGKGIINDWIEQQTSGKISDAVKDDMVEKALFLLINTIYFNGDWQVSFSENSTFDSIFTDRYGIEATTPFMNNTSYYKYYENDSFRMIAKPYKDNNIQMYFILPEEDCVLTGSQFDEADTEMYSTYVRFSVPKFKTEFQHENLIEILKALGVSKAFSWYEADFRDMLRDLGSEVNVFINEVSQKTFIEVDEKGTKAAAVTIGGGMTTSIEPEPIDFICDRPFIYIIRDDLTGTILFVGEYAFVQ